MSVLDINEKKKLSLTCTYREKEKAKMVAGYKWDGDNKVWTYPLNYQTISELKEQFPRLSLSDDVKRYIANVEKARRAFIALKQQKKVKLNIPWYNTLRDYQTVGAYFLMKGKKIIMGDDMGTGKTLQTLTAIEALDLTRVIIVVPNSLKYNWEEEINKWTDSKCLVMDGGRKTRESIIEQYKNDKSIRYLITNYASVRNYEGLQKIKWQAEVYDEAHKLKNRKSQQTKKAKKIKAEYTFLLTGTPILNRAEELWSLLNKLYPKKFSSYWRFVENYCEMRDNGFGIDILEGDEHQKEQLRQLIAPVMIRRTKKEVMPELPEKIHRDLPVKLEGKQAKIYKEMEQNMFTELENGEIVAAPVVIAQLMRLRQIAISPELIGEEGAKSAKFKALLELVEDNIEDQKIVVFSQFKQAIKLFGKILTDKGIDWLEVSGDVKGKARQQATNEFQNNPDKRIMLATIEAASLGLTWTAANIGVFLDRHWTPAINRQAEDRLHRMGQKGDVTIVNMIAKGTVEERIQLMLADKAQTFDDIINDSIKITPQMVYKILGREKK
jgi:SNF2 family DNA or RNA helicase